MFSLFRSPFLSWTWRFLNGNFFPSSELRSRPNSAFRALLSEPRARSSKRPIAIDWVNSWPAVYGRPISTVVINCMSCLTSAERAPKFECCDFRKPKWPFVSSTPPMVSAHLWKRCFTVAAGFPASTHLLHIPSSSPKISIRLVEMKLRRSGTGNLTPFTSPS